MLDREGHTVSVIDQSSAAFQRLPSEFQGSEFVGNGVDEEVLLRAGIKEADAFIAVTNGDNRNIMASQMAREIFKVKKSRMPYLRSHPGRDVPRTRSGDLLPHSARGAAPF
jgi:trk system potassium uptake protein TrkA